MLTIIRPALLACGVSLLTLAAPATAQDQAEQSSSASFEAEVPDAAFTGERSRLLMTAQILLDRAGHSPGVIDGYGGGNTARALRAFEKAKGLDTDGELDDEVLSALREQVGSDPLVTRYTVTQEDVSGTFRAVPADMAAMAERDRIGYSSASELFAEKFHMSEGLLAALNPEADFGSAGTEILVVQAGSAEIEGTVARIAIDKSASEVRAYDASDTLLATFPATVGSSEFPSPSGTMEVSAIAMEANYTFAPDSQDWGGDEALVIPPGPNNPIGGVWIDLGKDGYGIHGTSDPSSIGKTASHGCVRLTNWDARALARAVQSGSTKVAFD